LALEVYDIEVFPTKDGRDSERGIFDIEIRHNEQQGTTFRLTPSAMRLAIQRMQVALAEHEDYAKREIDTEEQPF
jgi:hypothetical protein